MRASTTATSRPGVRLAARPAATARAPRRRSVAARAEISPSVALAISQQAIAFAVVVAGEGLYQRALIPATAPGRPSPAIFGGGAAATLAAAALVSGGGAGAGAGLALGAAASLAVLASSVKRALDVKPATPNDWPGPFAWPAFTALAAFFMLSGFGQALRG